MRTTPPDVPGIKTSPATAGARRSTCRRERSAHVAELEDPSATGAHAAQATAPAPPPAPPHLSAHHRTSALAAALTPPPPLL